MTSSTSFQAPARTPFLSGQVVLITGATGNLGATVARACAVAGARLMLCERSGDQLARQFPELAASDEHLLATGIDLADEASVARLVAAGMERSGRIDALVNTVGAWRGGRSVDEDEWATWDFLWRVNVQSAWNVSHVVGREMRRQRRGRIVHVASADAWRADAGFSAYAASKAAVLRLTESLAAELNPHGITANAIVPATIDTPQNRAAMPDADHGAWVTPEAIAEVILFLLSDAARAVNGAAIPVTGRR
jgi:NAD(P)-dependent dehydrogenase (short-subunit alcohol dehydrogenase family)